MKTCEDMTLILCKKSINNGCSNIFTQVSRLLKHMLGHVFCVSAEGYFFVCPLRDTLMLECVKGLSSLEYNAMPSCAAM